MWTPVRLAVLLLLLLHDAQHGLHLLQDLSLDYMPISGVCSSSCQRLQCPAQQQHSTCIAVKADGSPGIRAGCLRAPQRYIRLIESDQNAVKAGSRLMSSNRLQDLCELNGQGRDLHSVSWRRARRVGAIGLAHMAV